MLAIASLLVVLVLSILVTRVATVALAHTGLSTEVARFQARSALTGAGFTTSESERVVNHPVRRRIVLLLMLVGNAGIVTAVSSLILAFVGDDEGGMSIPAKVLLLAAGLGVLWTAGSSSWVDRHLSAWIDRMLKRYAGIEVRDYASLMHLGGEYRLVELLVEPEDWVAGRTLAELALRDEGILVLGIRRQDGTYLGGPRGSTRIEAGDELLLYGREAAIERLDQRGRSMTAQLRHEQAVEEHEQVLREEAAADPVADGGTSADLESPATATDGDEASPRA